MLLPEMPTTRIITGSAMDVVETVEYQQDRLVDHQLDLTGQKKELEFRLLDEEIKDKEWFEQIEGIEDRDEIDDVDLTADEMAKQDNMLIALSEPGDAAVQLKDFKIKRVLDQGTFGKVFLVVNIHTGYQYAMKRINKDILIEKGQIYNTKTEKDILLQS